MGLRIIIIVVLSDDWGVRICCMKQECKTGVRNKKRMLEQHTCMWASIGYKRECVMDTHILKPFNCVIRLVTF